MTQRPIAQPLHRQLRDLIMARIDSAEWPAGTYLPPETKLAEEYGVAVGTLRKALLDLATEGVVQRRQGKGTVVSSHDSDAVLFRFLNLRRSDGSTLRPESRVLAREVVNLHAQDAAALQLLPGAQALRIIRVREADGAPILYEHILLDPARFGPLLNKPEVLPNTLYQLYQTNFGATVHRAHEHLRAVGADADCALELGCLLGTALLEIRRVAVDYLGNPIELRKSWVITSDLFYSSEI